MIINLHLNYTLLARFNRKKYKIKNDNPSKEDLAFFPHIFFRYFVYVLMRTVYFYRH